MSFGKMVKNIRIQLAMSQEQLARELNVSFSTVNRWENGRSRPSPMAKELFFSFCKCKNINISEIEDIEGGHRK